MKKIIKWTLFILIATAAMAAGMFALAQYLDSKEGEADTAPDSFTKKPELKSLSKSFNRHYTKLNL